jgi:transposase
MIVLVADARAQWAELDRRISAFDAEFVRWVKENEDARRLTTIPGVGPIVASALVAAVGRAESFERGRDLAAWLGLVPRQFTTGGKPKLLGISKRGNKYLRKTVDPWSACGSALCGRARHAAWPVGERADEQDPSQRRGRRLGQQAGEDRLGGAAARETV